LWKKKNGSEKNSKEIQYKEETIKKISVLHFLFFLKL